MRDAALPHDAVADRRCAYSYDVGNRSMSGMILVFRNKGSWISAALIFMMYQKTR